MLDSLAKAGLGNPAQYEDACAKVRAFLLQYPMKTGYWTDGHTDTDVNSNTYKSNMSASNMVLYLLDNPGFDPDWKADVPKLIRWTEDNFVFRTAPDEPATQWGANIVGEQDSFLYKMDYQTARYAAACARWYAVSGDQAYKEKAYRSLNWVTYCNNAVGQATESPVSIKKPISNWWSDCYGECPRMFYHAFARRSRLGAARREPYPVLAERASARSPMDAIPSATIPRMTAERTICGYPFFRPASPSERRASPGGRI